MGVAVAIIRFVGPAMIVFVAMIVPVAMVVFAAVAGVNMSAMMVTVVAPAVAFLGPLPEQSESTP